MAFAGDFRLRCRKCEGRLGRAKHVDVRVTGAGPNKFRVIIRRCNECKQLWLGYMLILSKGVQKIILKMIDKMP